MNSRLVYKTNRVEEKLYKFWFALSLVVYRRQRKNGLRNGGVQVIDNFDSDIKLKIDSRRSMGAAIFWTGYHEFREFIFLHAYLKPDMTFVDVGANIGEYTVFAAKRVPQGKVIAFEPLPSVRQFLEESIALNNFANVSVHPIGVSDEKGELEIHEVDSVHEGLATFFPGDRNTKRTFSVRLDTLDDILRDEKNVSVIKMDIEGGELKALKGGIKTLQKHKPLVMMEVNAETYRAAGYTTDDVHNFFSALGYQTYSIGKRGHLMRVIKMPEFGNIIFKLS